MENKVVLFGAGKDAEKLMEKYAGLAVAVIDNNKDGFWNDMPVISLSNYKEKYSECEILIASARYSKEIKEQLLENNILNFRVPDELFENKDVAHDEDISHDNWMKYLIELCDKTGAEILEVGSRCVNVSLRENFKRAHYTGFDYYPGKNVDVVGDAHKLSQYFEGKKFDLIFSNAVFEHLAMPWIASLEMIKLLKQDGYIFIETHYSYSSHERPWHFFQFSENALNVLFPDVFGIKCLKKGCSNLIKGEFSNYSSDYLQGRIVPGLYCHSEFLGKKVREVPESISWNDILLEDVVGSTQYPKPHK